jgi:hypothetical protein
MKTLINDPPPHPNPPLPSSPPPFLPQPPESPFPITCPSCTMSRSHALKSTIREKEQLENAE